MKRARLFLVVFLAVLSLGFLLKDRAQYHRSVWGMVHAADERESSEYEARIEALRGKVGNGAFVDTYSDTKLPNRVRRTAARALMKSDSQLAEALFRRYLDSSNTEASGMAIRDLGAMGSTRYRREILAKLASDNEVVRWSVVDYLGHFADAESVRTLEGVERDDRSPMIRHAASQRLAQLRKEAAKRASR